MNYWDRPTLKARGKNVLRMPGVYWTSVLVMLIYTVLAGVGGGSTAGGQSSSSGSDSAQYSDVMSRYGGYITIGVIVLIIVSILWAFFVSNVLTVGKNRYFLNCRTGAAKVGTLFDGFKNGNYMKNVGKMFAMMIRVFLWTLLLIVPVIIKYYEYWMVPYILAENPDIDKKRALEISSKTTAGEKGNIFVLQLSFIGWMLLGTLACGVGTLFVMPYCESTYAELFGALRYKAEKEGICAPGEIGVEPVVAPVQSAPAVPQ